MTNDQAIALSSLRRRWLAAAGLGIAAVTAGAVLLHPAVDRAVLARWLLVAAGVLGYQLAFVGRRLSLNRREGEDRLLPGLGPGNALTLARGILLAMLAGFLVVPWPRGALAWAPAVLYMAADLADYFDGYLARISRHATLLGQAIDMEFDALGLLAGVGVAIHLGQLPIGFLPFGLARYAFVLGVWVLERSGRRSRPLPESVSRRPIAGLTMAFVSAALWPVVIPPAAALAGVLFAVPFAASFGRDGLVVSGILDPESDLYRIWRRRLKRLLLDLLPPVLRAALAVALTLLTARMLESPPLWAPAPQAFFVGLQALAGVCIAVGFVGRLAAVGLIVPLGLGAYADGLSPLRGWALGLAIAILILGTGAASMWKPEETRLRLRAGERDD
jgi:CDP-diacylglycerol---glycerol-3-phosphate 3-phosphatidyltransferase